MKALLAWFNAWRGVHTIPHPAWSNPANDSVPFHPRAAWQVERDDCYPVLTGSVRSQVEMARRPNETTMLVRSPAGGVRITELHHG